MSRLQVFVFLSVFNSFVLCFLNAQVQTGTPKFGTFSTPGPEVINVGNLNVLLDIPVLRKQGRRLPLNYDLVYNSSIWNRVTSGSTTSWQPSPTMGWAGLSPAGVAGVSYSMTYATGQCYYNNGVVNYQSWTYSAGSYTDASGVSSSLSGQIVAFNSPGGSCPSGSQPSNTLKLTSSDGSGLTGYMTIQGFGGPATFQIMDRQGNTSFPPGILNMQAQQGTSSQTDPNGNTISLSNGQYTDTTGHVAFNVLGSNTGGTNLSFTNASGKPSTYAVSYMPYTLQTAFGCTVGEYGPTATSLVDRVTLPDNSFYQFHYEATPNASGKVTGRLASVTLPTGGTISYSYTGGSNGIVCADGSTAGLTRVTAATQAGPASTWSYSRTPAATSSQTQIVDGSGNYSLYNFGSQSNNAFALLETHRRVYQGATSGPLLLERLTCYNQTAPPCDTQFISYPFSEVDVTSMYNGGNSDVQQNAYDNLLNLTGLGVYQGSTLMERTAYTYNQYNSLASAKLYDGAGNLFSSTVYGFDETPVTPTTGIPQHNSAAAKPGNQTSVTVSTSASSTIATTTAFYDTGVPVSTKSPNGTTSYQHDSTQTFLQSAALPTPSSGVALSTGASYDQGSGVLLSASGTNIGQTLTVNQYDSLLRPTSLTMPNGGQVSSTYTPTQTSFSQNLNKSTGENAAVTTLTDAYGRPMSSAVLSSSSNTWYQSDTCYDQDGNVSFSSLRYQSGGVGGAVRCSGAGASYTYDALGRATGTTTTDGIAAVTYLNRAVMTTDVNGVRKITQYDVLGRITGVCELSSNGLAGQSPTACNMDKAGTGYVTGYGYDLAGHTTSVAQGTQTRYFQTDWIGRPVINSEPERGFTSYSYGYNSLGLQVIRTRPRANQVSTTVYTHTTTQYDSVGRPVSIAYDDGLTPNKNYYYDTVPSSLQWTQSPSNPKGQLVATSSGSGSTSTKSFLSYDLMGNVPSMFQCAPSICGGSSQASRSLSLGYDLGNNLTSENDGASGAIAYARSPAGEVTSITNTTYQGTGNPPNLVSNVVNTPVGHTSYTLGNGLQAVSSFDSLGRVSGSWVCNGSSQNGCGGGTKLYGNSATWRGMNMTQSCDTINNQCQNQGYDEFNRLSSLTATSLNGQGNYTYTYDRWGNRLSQTSASGGPSPSVAVSSTTNQVSGFSYDAAGNIVSDGIAHTFTYDAEGNVLQINKGGSGSYVYDAFNNRVSVKTPSGTNEYLFDQAGRRISTWDASNNFGNEGRIYWDGKQIAYRAFNGQTFCEHQSIIGTEHLRTNYQGATATTETSLAFGDNYKQNVSLASGDQDNNEFAGTENDAESFSNHAGFRQYSPTLGRWMSPDPYDGSYDIGNPQSFTRYTYASNSPYSFVDPSGLLDVVCSKVNFYVDGILDSTITTCFDLPTGAYGGGGGGGGGGGIYRSAPNNFHRMPLPGNALTCTTNTGITFNAPPGFDVFLPYLNGEDNGLVGAGSAVGQGGTYDYQRQQVGGGTNFYSGYTSVANIAVGAYLYGAGVSPRVGSFISNTYAFFKSGNGATAQQAQFRNLGFDLASGKATYTCQPHL